MGITMQDVEHVARLARLEFGEEEKLRLTNQLNAIFDYIAKLNELDTGQVEPTSHPFELANVMRADEARPSWPLQQVMLNAPDEEDGQFKVPAVLE